MWFDSRATVPALYNEGCDHAISSCHCLESHFSTAISAIIEVDARLSKYSKGLCRSCLLFTGPNLLPYSGSSFFIAVIIFQILVLVFVVDPVLYSPPFWTCLLCRLWVLSTLHCRFCVISFTLLDLPPLQSSGAFPTLLSIWCNILHASGLDSSAVFRCMSAYLLSLIWCALPCMCKKSKDLSSANFAELSIGCICFARVLSSFGVLIC